MPTHTTNYFSTFIEVAEDCPASCGEVPPSKEGGEKSMTTIQFDLIANHPYKYTSNEVLFSFATLLKET